MEKGKKQISKKAKKQPEVIEEFGEVNEVTDDEIQELEDELKVLDEKDSSYGSPKPNYNKGMELQLIIGNFVVFKNVDGILYQISINPEVEELVLEKIKVVV